MDKKLKIVKKSFAYIGLIVLVAFAPLSKVTAQTLVDRLRVTLEVSGTVSDVSINVPRETVRRQGASVTTLFDPSNLPVDFRGDMFYSIKATQGKVSKLLTLAFNPSSCRVKVQLTGVMAQGSYKNATCELKANISFGENGYIAFRIVADKIALLASTAVSPASANSQDIPWYIIRARHSGQCLNILDLSNRNAAIATQGEACGQTPNFLWTPMYVDYLVQDNGVRINSYRFIVKHSKQCLNVLNNDTRNGAPVVQGSRCDTQNFTWRLEALGGGWYHIRNIQTNQCLNVLDAAMNNGARVVQGELCDTKNFEWNITNSETGEPFWEPVK